MKIETAAQKPTEEKWWIFILIGIFFIGFGAYMFADLAQLEQQGGERKLMWIFAILFNAFGKWGVMLPIMCLGLATSIAGLIKRIKRTK